jgi:hypothetical protein
VEGPGGGRAARLGQAERRATAPSPAHRPPHHPKFIPPPWQEFALAAALALYRRRKAATERRCEALMSLAAARAADLEAQHAILVELAALEAATVSAPPGGRRSAVGGRAADKII